MTITMSADLPCAPARYTKFSGNADLVYGTICRILAGKQDAVEWARFSAQDWTLLLQMAHVELEGIGPMLYWQYRNGSWPAEMPTHVCRKLEQSYYNTLASNMLLYDQLKVILAAFERAGITAIVLKGAALALTVYEDIGLRPMGDLDLLIQKSDQDRAARILSGLGFEPGWDRPVSRTWLPERHQSFQKRGKVHMIVELHESLIGDRNDIRTPALDWPFRHTLALNLKPKYEDMATLVPEAHALFLSAHAYQQHGLQNVRLIWLLDLWYLLRHPAYSYEKSLGLVEKLPWGTGYRLALENLQGAFDLAVPEEVLTRLEALRDEQMDRLVMALSGAELDRVSVHRSEIGFLNLRGRLRYSLSILFPPMEYLDQRYQFLPRSLWLLYYPVRWLDVVKNYLQAR